MRILVSACLLGSPCKYNGGDNLCPRLLELAQGHTLIPLCPEQLGGLSTPRPPAERKDGRVITQSGKDVTECYQKGAAEVARLARLLGVEAAILKARSPACGCGSIYDGTFTHTEVAKNGLAAEALLALGIPVYTEEHVPDFSSAEDSHMRDILHAMFVMTGEIFRTLEACHPSIYLYGSLTLDDFQPGWSDIDMLCLTREPLSVRQAEHLVDLRQRLQEKEPKNPFYRSFEGGILTLDAFLSHKPDRVVYWGTSGQRITQHHTFDCFSMVELLEHGILLWGEDVRNQLTKPSYEALRQGVQGHYESIRKYATGARSFYTFGWFLDIARCIYTLRTGQIISKTAAGKWALEQQLCPTPEALTKALTVRINPLCYQNDSEIWDYAETLGDDIQKFADVLEEELAKGTNTHKI